MITGTILLRRLRRGNGKSGRNRYRHVPDVDDAVRPRTTKAVRLEIAKIRVPLVFAVDVFSLDQQPHFPNAVFETVSRREARARDGFSRN